MCLPFFELCKVPVAIDDDKLQGNGRSSRVCSVGVGEDPVPMRSRAEDLAGEHGPCLAVVRSTCLLSFTACIELMNTTSTSPPQCPNLMLSWCCFALRPPSWRHAVIYRADTTSARRPSVVEPKETEDERTYPNACSGYRMDGERCADRLFWSTLLEQEVGKAQWFQASKGSMF